MILRADIKNNYYENKMLLKSCGIFKVSIFEWIFSVIYCKFYSWNLTGVISCDVKMVGDDRKAI